MSITYAQLRCRQDEFYELDAIRWALLRHNITPYEVLDRLEVLARPVSVRCYICRRGAREIPGDYVGPPPPCSRCEQAACEVTGCYATAAVAVDWPNGTQVLCEGHGVLAIAGDRPVAGVTLRHVVGAERRRASYDHTMRSNHLQVA